MRRKVLLVVLLIGAMVIGVVGGIACTESNRNAQELNEQNLFGVCRWGNFAMPPEGTPPYYYSMPNLIITNPDLTYDKTVERIVVTKGTDGTIVLDLALSGEDARLAPNEVLERDFEQLAPQGSGGNYRLYNVNVYCKGSGEPLRGWIEEWLFLIEITGPEEGYIMDLGQIVKTEMVDIMSGDTETVDVESGS